MYKLFTVAILCLFSVSCAWAKKATPEEVEKCKTEQVITKSEDGASIKLSMDWEVVLRCIESLEDEYKNPTGKKLLGLKKDESRKDATKESVVADWAGFIVDVVGGEVSVFLKDGRWAGFPPKCGADVEVGQEIEHECKRELITFCSRILEPTNLTIKQSLGWDEKCKSLVKAFGEENNLNDSIRRMPVIREKTSERIRYFKGDAG